MASASSVRKVLAVVTARLGLAFKAFVSAVVSCTVRVKPISGLTSAPSAESLWLTVLIVSAMAEWTVIAETSRLVPLTVSSKVRIRVLALRSRTNSLRPGVTVSGNSALVLRPSSVGISTRGFPWTSVTPPALTAIKEFASVEKSWISALMEFTSSSPN